MTKDIITKYSKEVSEFTAEEKIQRIQNIVLTKIDTEIAMALVSIIVSPTNGQD